MAATDILSDKSVKAATEAGKARKISDGGGLVLEARPTGAGWWRLRSWIDKHGRPAAGGERYQRTDQRQECAQGKTPSMFYAGGLAGGIPEWTKRQSTPADVAKWSKDGRLGICLQTRRVRAIDIDDGGESAARVRELIEMMLGALPVRSRSNSGKCLMLIDMPGSFSKRVIKTPHGAIEFLAAGQQCIVAGTHPSGARYEWAGGLPKVIPRVTPEHFEPVWQGLQSLFGVEGGGSTSRAPIVPAARRSAANESDLDVAWLDARGGVTGYDSSGRVDVRCPWEHEHTSDSGPNSTSYYPIGVGGEAHAVFTCLYAHCASRTIFEFRHAVGLEAEETFRGGEMVAPIGTHEWRPPTDADYTGLCMRTERSPTGFAHIAREMIREMVHSVAERNKFDSAQQWLGGLAWDGVPRVDTFLRDHLGAEDTPYTRAVSCYLLTAGAACWSRESR